MTEKHEKKEGVTVQELENFGKKYKFELAFLVYFVLATITAQFMWHGWSLYLTGIGAVLGIWLPEKVSHVARAAFTFALSQEKMIQLVFAGVGVLVSIFLAPLVFLLLGAVGGVGIYSYSSKMKG